jgi:arylsulfatase A-like enzyme
MTNLHQGFEEMHEAGAFDRDGFRTKTARSVVDHALNWLERHKDTPFFMYVHVTDPHSPFKPRPPYDTVYADAAKGPEHAKNWERLRGFIETDFMKNQEVATRAEVEKSGLDREQWLSYEKDYYDGSILGMDAEIGRIRESLQQLGLDRKVMFAFIADHGEEFQEHGRMFHGHTPYGDLGNVPLVLRWPGVIPGDTKISETVRSIDLMPTLLDISGLTIPESAQGQSLLPLIAAARNGTGNASEAAQKLGWEKRPAVTEKNKRGDSGLDARESYALLLDGWKLVHNVQNAENSPEFELFNHHDDPLDLKNVAAEHPDIVEKLKTELAAWHKIVEDAKLPEADSTAGLAEEEIKRLRTLGYIQ